MSEFKVYIACPMSVSQARINDLATRIKTSNSVIHMTDRIVVNFWVRGAVYSDKDVREADAIIVLLDNNGGGAKVGEISKGTRGEMILAKNLKKPIYLAYTPKNPTPTPFIYCTNANDIDLTDDDDNFFGIQGTSGALVKHAIQWEKDNPYDKAPQRVEYPCTYDEAFKYDERLLILLL